MVTAAIWGFVQGLTEFLPISSSGHLVLIPALLGIDEPDLSTTAVLHLGTLAAVIWFYRVDLTRLVSDPLSATSKRIWTLLLLGTIPAGVIGLTLRSPIEIIFTEPWIVAVCLVITGLVLLGAHKMPLGERTVEEGTAGDAVIVGFAQAFALLPGISRSGMTITGGLAQGFSRFESARLAFLLGIPTIAGAGAIETLDVIQRGEFEWSLLVGTAVAAVTGYFAIKTLLRLIERYGLLPFGLYCVAFGTAAYFLL